MQPARPSPRRTSELVKRPRKPLAIFDDKHSNTTEYAHQIKAFYPSTRIRHEQHYAMSPPRRNPDTFIAITHQDGGIHCWRRRIPPERATTG